MLPRRCPPPAASAAPFLCLHEQASTCWSPAPSAPISGRARPVPIHQSPVCAARHPARSDRRPSQRLACNQRGTSDLASICTEIRREFISGFGTGASWQVADPDSMIRGRSAPLVALTGTRFAAGRGAHPRGAERWFWGRRVLRYRIGTAFSGDGRHAQLSSFGAAAVRIEAQRRTIRM
jgi:hypothetical protein